MAKVSVKWNRGGAYNGEIRKIQFVAPETMRDAGIWLAVQLQNRTQGGGGALGGRDETGATFRPYSESYARAKGVPRNHVDLTRSGKMFAAFGVLSYTTNRVLIGFTDKAMEARARYNEENGRKFLGIDARWLASVRNRLIKGLPF